MNLQNAFEYIQSRFDCRHGYAAAHVDGRYITRAPERATYKRGENSYKLLIYTLDGIPDDMSEHVLVSRVITDFGRMADRQVRAGRLKPKLYWRLRDRIEVSKTPSQLTFTTRVFIEGVTDYGWYRSKCDKPDLHMLLVWSKPAPEITMKSDQMRPAT